jgi:hypothetical protein
MVNDANNWAVNLKCIILFHRCLQEKEQKKDAHSKELQFAQKVAKQLNEMNVLTSYQMSPGKKDNDGNMSKPFR